MAPFKPCPGVNGRRCGAAIESSGYCVECRREYQRNRYRAMREAASLQYSTRAHIRAATPKCISCGKTNGTQKLIAIPPDDGMCDPCAFTLMHIVDNINLERLEQVLALHKANPEVYRMLKTPAVQHRLVSHPVLNAAANEYKKALNTTVPAITFEEPVEDWENIDHVLYAVFRYRRFEEGEGNDETLEELRTWWDKAPDQLLDELSREEYKNILGLIRSNPPKTDPEIKAALIEQDLEAAEILRNYEFVPSGPPSRIEQSSE